MHRIDGSGAAPGNLFTDGDPQIGTPATIATDDWLNAVQEELCNVITSQDVELAKPDNTQLLQALRKLVAAAVPPGAVQAFAMATAPAGWLICNGAAVDRVAYAALFAAVGTAFGAGNGSTTFNLPDLRGEFIRGLDGGRGVDAGRGIGTPQADDFKAHVHEAYAMYGGSPPPGFTYKDTGLGNAGGGTPDDSYNTYDTKSAGGTETRPRNVAMQFCIKT